MRHKHKKPIKQSPFLVSMFSIIFDYIQSTSQEKTSYPNQYHKKKYFQKACIILITDRFEKSNRRDCNKTIGIMDMDCSICWKPFTFQNDVSTTDCGHVFHTKCIMDWFLKHPGNSCALCRTNQKKATNVYNE